MGQAKLRKLAGDYPAPLAPEQIETIRSAATATAKTMRATSLRRGKDCVAHANLLVALLKRHGIPARVAVGYAAWRVGAGVGDVVANHPSCVAPAPGKFIGHAWVAIGKLVADATTWALPHKLAGLDEADGCTSTCSWAPDILVADRSHCSSFVSTTNAYTFTFYYEERAELIDVLVDEELDADLVTIADKLMVNPHARVNGPATMAYGELGAMA